MSSSALRIYFDNDVASAISRRDLEEEEMSAIDGLKKLDENGRVKIVVSRQSSREMGRAPSHYQQQLKDGLSQLELGPEDHRLLGFQALEVPRGIYSVLPVISDIVDPGLYSQLRKTGLNDDDAKHLMYAVTNGCNRFVTCDRHFLNRRDKLEGLCPSLKIQKPSECLTELIPLESRRGCLSLVPLRRNQPDQR